MFVRRLDGHVLHDFAALVRNLLADPFDSNGPAVLQRLVAASDGVQPVLNELGRDLSLVLRLSKFSVFFRRLNDIGAVAVVSDSTDYSPLRHIVRLGVVGQIDPRVLLMGRMIRILRCKRLDRVASKVHVVH